MIEKQNKSTNRSESKIDIALRIFVDHRVEYRNSIVSYLKKKSFHYSRQTRRHVSYDVSNSISEWKRGLN